MTGNVLRLFRLRWNVPILAELYASDGAKFITLVRKLGISRSVLSSTLKQLISGGWVIPNPGYGHPLRPEYILTPAGRKASPFCRDLVNATLEQGEGYLLQSKWALPLLFALDGAEIRFSELKSRLGSITPRALSEELKQLNGMGYVQRKIIEEFPPISIYRLTPKAQGYTEIYERHRRELENLPERRR